MKRFTLIALSALEIPVPLVALGLVLTVGCEGRLITYDNTEAPKSGELAQYSAPIWPAPSQSCSSAEQMPFQLGVASRIGVYDYDPTTMIANGHPYFECASSPSEVFFDESDPSSQRFEAQSAFSAAATTLAIVDGLVEDPRVGGWDYDTVNFPDMVGTRPALLVTVNDPECAGIGRMWPIPETLAHAEAHDHPIPSAGAFGANGYLYARVMLCGASKTGITGTIFHEMGHYLDHNLGNYDGRGLGYPFGVMSDQLDGGTLSGCCMDSYREGTALAETIGQLVALYMFRRAVPSMDYTISNAEGAAGSCTLAELDITSTTIVHPDCIGSGGGPGGPGGLGDKEGGGEPSSMVQKFRSDAFFRPQADASSRCDDGDGYNIPSLLQAWWALLYGQACTEDPSLSCTDYTGSTVDPEYADRYMLAMLWALKQGNSVSYIGFWDRMETFIAAEFPGDLALFQHVRDLHEIHPINADGTPVCGGPAGGRIFR